MKNIDKLIKESVKKALKEEVENTTSINNKIVDLISMLHNSQKDLRELHWNTRNYARHKVTDDAVTSVFEWEDTMAEVYIKNSGNELLINDTKPSEKDFQKILEQISEMASNLKEDISDKLEYDRMCAVIDDILENCSKMLYLAEME